MLTERQIERSWRKLFCGGSFEEDAFDKAVSLLDELRPESPLRHRLSVELAELRKLQKQG